MKFAFLTNFVTRLKRKSTQVALNQKSRTQRNISSNGTKFVENDNKKAFSFFGRRGVANINFKFIIIPILILIVGLFVFHGIKIVKAWIDYSPKPYSGNTPSEYIWQGNNKLTVAVIGTDQIDKEHTFIDAIGIYSTDPIGKKLAVFMINPDLKVYVSSLGKEVNFRTMLNDKNLKGDKMLIIKNAVSALLAVKVDKYLLVDKKDITQITKLFNPLKVEVPKDVVDKDQLKLPSKTMVNWNKGKDQIVVGQNYLEFFASDNNGRDDQLQRQQNLLSALPFGQNSIRTFLELPNIINSMSMVSTDLTKSEIILAINKISEIKDSDVKKGFTRESSYSKTNSIAYYSVFSPDLAQIDQDINNIFFDVKIFKEQAKIEVLNASSVRGLANSRGRWITNLGARIIKIGNSLDRKEKTTIYCEDASKYPYTIAELQRIFNYKAIIVQKDYPNRHVGDVVVELGDLFE